jgi:hypothetical protein
MKRSDGRILTTHAGSLTRPGALREAWSKPTATPQDEAQLQSLLKQSVSGIVADQVKAGVDIPNDGEFGKPMRSTHDLAAWGTYIFGRLSGFGKASRPAPEQAVAGQPMRIVARVGNCANSAISTPRRCRTCRAWRPARLALARSSIRGRRRFRPIWRI